jgi:hypothetical protein
VGICVAVRYGSEIRDSVLRTALGSREGVDGFTNGKTETLNGFDAAMSHE